MWAFSMEGVGFMNGCRYVADGERDFRGHPGLRQGEETGLPDLEFAPLSELEPMGIATL